MIPVSFENIAVSKIELDRDNPRIRRFLGMYPDPIPEQIYVALGAGAEAFGKGGSKRRRTSSSFVIRPFAIGWNMSFPRSKNEFVSCGPS